MFLQFWNWNPLVEENHHCKDRENQSVTVNCNFSFFRLYQVRQTLCSGICSDCETKITMDIRKYLSTSKSPAGLKAEVVEISSSDSDEASRSSMPGPPDAVDSHCDDGTYPDAFPSPKKTSDGGGVS